MMALKWYRKNLRICMKYQVGKVLFSILYPKVKAFYLIECFQQVVLNEAKRPIEFESKCNECGYIWGFMVVFLRILMLMCFKS